MKTSDNLDKIAPALVEMQSQIEAASKSSKAHRYKYADLNEVWKTIRNSLHLNKLAVIQDAYSQDDRVFVTTTILHASGQFIHSNPLSIHTGKVDAHSQGSSCSYAKRYQLCALLGVSTADADDDGKLAMEKPKESPKTITVAEYEKLHTYIAGDQKLLGEILGHTGVERLQDMTSSQLAACRLYIGERNKNS